MTTAEKFQIPCFLCGKYVPVKDTKRDKPYFICDDCGLQVFVRCKPGIARFKRLLSEYRNRPSAFMAQEQRIYRYMQLLSRMSELKGLYKKLEEPQYLSEYFFIDSEKEQALKSIRKKIKHCEDQLSKYFKST